MESARVLLMVVLVQILLYNAAAGTATETTFMSFEGEFTFVDAYTDPVSNITHMLVKVNTNPRLMYISLHNGRVSQLHFVDESYTPCQGQITGPADGHTVYVLVTNYQRRNIYFLESIDNGLTWLEHIRWDGQYSQNVELVNVRQTNWLSVFYVKYNDSGPQCLSRYYRLPDEKSWNAADVYCRSGLKTMVAKVAPYLYDSEPRLCALLCLQLQGEDKVETWLTHNRLIRWEVPVQVEFPGLDLRVPPILLSNVDIESERLFLLYSSSTGMKLVISTPKVVNWSSAIQTEATVQSLKAVLCGSRITTRRQDSLTRNFRVSPCAKAMLIFSVSFQC